MSDGKKILKRETLFEKMETPDKKNISVGLW